MLASPHKVEDKLEEWSVDDLYSRKHLTCDELEGDGEKSTMNAMGGLGHIRKNVECKFLKILSNLQAPC